MHERIGSFCTLRLWCLGCREIYSLCVGLLAALESAGLFSTWNRKVRKVLCSLSSCLLPEACISKRERERERDR